MTDLNTPTIDNNGLLRLLTCGNVDDGKSTLIGRLLFDSKTILADTLSVLEKTSKKRGMEEVDLSLLTDGLQAEREQGITIDVAYRYFSTGTRKFIMADAPGHEQYTRNMVTAASTADLSIILIDARKGVQTQTRRHTYLSHLVGISHLVVAVNKMDLVDYDEVRFEEIKKDYLDFAKQLNISDVTFIPLSALRGDMVVDRGENLSWYQGPTLIETLESAPLSSDERKWLRRLNWEVRKLDSAITDQSVTVLLEDEIDISRGDMIVKTAELPDQKKQVEATVCWLAEVPLDKARTYQIRHTTRESKAKVIDIAYRVDVNTLERQETDQLNMNDIARVTFKTANILLTDAYADNRVFLVNGIIIALAVLIHYEFLFRMSSIIPKMKIKHRFRIVAGVLGALVAHSVEVLLFSVAYYFLPKFPELGSLEGNFNGSLFDSVYFSYTTFTTLGFGDIQPIGHIRSLVGLESLTGLLLITWTASFLYYEMQRHWNGK
ncbi:Sulfate adenylyltransferase subunit 1 [Nymphon striatum]|nr:Sulfate adenylyltransferase subunit 1 [Nymphon striatum]